MQTEMNKYMKNLIKFGLFAFFLMSDFMVFAQQPGDEDNNGNLEGGDPAPAPINGKLIFLVLAGLVFAIYTFRRNRKEA